MTLRSKCCREGFAANEERVSRFEREAKLLASLNHPNIASIHGFEDEGGVKALVLELVEGPTLAERIEHSAIPVEEVLVIVGQIAEALAARARGRRHPPRSEAGEHQAQARRHGEGAGLWARESVRASAGRR